MLLSLAFCVTSLVLHAEKGNQRLLDYLFAPIETTEQHKIEKDQRSHYVGDKQNMTLSKKQ